MISANQFSICGAIADLCGQVPKGIWAPGRLAALDHFDKMEMLTDFSTAVISTNAQLRRNLV